MAIRLDRSPLRVRARKGGGETPRNRTRRDCRDDQQHDRREDLSEGPRAATAGLTEGESFRSKPKGGDHGDRIPNRRQDSAEASSLINPFDPSLWRDPYSHYPSLLAGPPRLLPLLLPTVLVARHRDVVNVLRDHELFSSSSPQLSLLAKLDPFAGAQTMLFSDPPVHTRLRRLVTPNFRPGRINLLTPRIQTLTD